MAAHAISETFIPAKNIRSLVWSGDSLVDWVVAGDVYHLDGSFEPSRGGYPFNADAAVSAPHTEFAVTYRPRGNQGAAAQEWATAS